MCLVLLIVFCFLVAFANAAVPSKLVPSKRAALERRTVSRRDLAPRETVVLSYADAPYLLPSASVILTSHTDRPFLLLEDFDHILQDISCSLSAITVTFADDKACSDTTNVWSELRRFVIITAHDGCNEDGEHAAWAIERSFVERAGRKLTFIATPVPWRDVVRSFAVKYDHSGANTWDAREAVALARRDEHSLNQNFAFAFNPDIPARMPLFPPAPTGDNSVADAAIGKLADAGIALTCIDCVMKTNVTIGVDFAVDIADSTSCITDSNVDCFTFSSAAMNITIENFELGAALEVSLNAEISDSTKYTILSIPVAPGLKVPGLVDIGPGVGLQVGFEMDLTGSINFTYGAKGKIPDKAFASASLVNSTGDWDPEFHAKGWDGTGVDQIPFRLNGGDMNVTMGLAFAPFAEVAFSILNVGAALRLVQSVPKVVASAAVHQNVNRQCVAINDTDYESFGSAVALGAGMELGLDAELVLQKGHFVGHGIPKEYSASLYNVEVPLAPARGSNDTGCFVLADAELVVQGNKGKQLTLGGVPAPTGTLYTAASAIPTWNIPRIQAYYSAHKQLPTNVNYLQMARATTVPDDIKSAVSAAATAQENGAGVARSPTKGLQWLVAGCVCIFFSI